MISIKDADDYMNNTVAPWAIQIVITTNIVVITLISTSAYLSYLGI